MRPRARLPIALVALVALSALACAACAAIAGLGDAYTAGDAGDAGGDGAADARARDGSLGSDAPSRWCDGHRAADLCEDFDLGPLPGAFDALEVQATSVAVRTDGGVSQPDCLLAVAPGTPSAPARADLVKTFSGSPSTVVCALQIAADKIAGAADETEVLNLAFHSAQPPLRYNLGLQVNTQGARVVEYGEDADGGVTVFNVGSASYAPSQQWVDVRLRVDFASGSYAASVGSASFTTPQLSPPPQRDSVVVRVGIPYAEEASTVRVDNVVCTLTP